MLNLMPGEISKFIRNMSRINLNDFFGFCLAEVTTPDNILRPLLPYRNEDGKTIFPTGTWKAVYFSEELKAVAKLGYKVKLISGYEFTKVDLFSKYVEHFYDQKKISEGAERFIAKMHLNQLYGIFGRKRELLETINVRTSDIPKFLTTKIVKTIIEINDDISTLLVYNNVPNNIVNKLNSSIYNKGSSLNSAYKLVRTNVAIASAVTAYARIHMIPFKLDDGICYTDTDSIFTTTKLDESKVGKKLGQMKDELNGLTIKEAFFLGIKKYGYQYINPNNETITSSVFSGIERNSLSFDEVKAIFNGDKITKNIPTRFFKSFSKLDINIVSNSTLTIKSGSKKLLDGNRYIPIHLNQNKFISYLDSKTIKLKISIKRLLTKLTPFH